MHTSRSSSFTRPSVPDTQRCPLVSTANAQVLGPTVHAVRTRGPSALRASSVGHTWVRGQRGPAGAPLEAAELFRGVVCPALLSEPPHVSSVPGTPSSPCRT